MSFNRGKEQFFAYARERYRIHLRRSHGQERPWTGDRILQQFRFCNVFREDDKVTQYIRAEITSGAYGDKLVQAMVIARWFNRPETIDILLGAGVRADLLLKWSSKKVRSRLEDVSPLVTGAFMVKTPAKMSKLEGLIQCIEQANPIACQLQKYIEKAPRAPSLKFACHWLQQAPYLGPFMAYEVVTDLRHTPLLDKAPDIMTWANPGPGCARGAGRVFAGSPNFFSLGNKRHRQEIDFIMQRLLSASQIKDHWPFSRQWEMREVEHTLCEFDKYERARLGEGTPKQRYEGGAQ